MRRPVFDAENASDEDFDRHYGIEADDEEVDEDEA